MTDQCARCKKDMKTHSHLFSIGALLHDPIWICGTCKAKWKIVEDIHQLARDAFLNGELE